MRGLLYRRVLIAVWTLALLSVAGRASAIAIGQCCVCDLCDGVVDCVEAVDDCSVLCGQVVNVTVCGSEFVNSTCTLVPACAAGAPLGAPALGTTGLTVATLFLAAFGALGLWRSTRRKPPHA